MPRPRGTVSRSDRVELLMLLNRVEDAQAEYRARVVEVLTGGASFSAVAEVTGLSTNTLQRWKRVEAGK